MFSENMSNNCFSNQGCNREINNNCSNNGRSGCNCGNSRNGCNCGNNRNSCNNNRNGCNCEEEVEPTRVIVFESMRNGGCGCNGNSGCGCNGNNCNCPRQLDAIRRIANGGCCGQFNVDSDDYFLPSNTCPR